MFFHLQGAEKGPGQGLRQPESAAERRLLEQLKRGVRPLRKGSKIAPRPKYHTVRGRGSAKSLGDELMRLLCDIICLMSICESCSRNVSALPPRMAGLFPLSKESAQHRAC